MAENNKRNPIPLDSFGFIEVWAAHFDLALTHMHPTEAVKAANAAVTSYGNSYQFALMTHKGSEVAEYRMLHRKPNGGGAN